MCTGWRTMLWSVVIRKGFEGQGRKLFLLTSQSTVLTWSLHLQMGIPSRSRRVCYFAGRMSTYSVCSL